MLSVAWLSLWLYFVQHDRLRSIPHLQEAALTIDGGYQRRRKNSASPLLDMLILVGAHESRKQPLATDSTQGVIHPSILSR